LIDFNVMKDISLSIPNMNFVLTREKSIISIDNFQAEIIS